MPKKRKKANPKRSAPTELSLRDYQLLAEFRYLLARFLAFSEAAAQESGLASRQHQALLAIKGYPDGANVTVGRLAERLGIRHHSAVGLVDRLVTSGYLTRVVDANDRRRIFLSLTKRGEEILSELSAIHREELHRMIPLLKPVLGQLGPSDIMHGQ